MSKKTLSFFIFAFLNPTDKISDRTTRSMIALNSIAGYDLLSGADQALAFDYNGDGKQDLFLYRPGRGAAWVARFNGDGSFTGVYTVIKLPMLSMQVQ